MAHYDKDTEKFMEDVAPSSKKSQVARSAISVAKHVARGKNLGEALARQAIAIPTFAALEKTGSAGVLSIYKLLNSHYNRDWWDWEPETIWQTLDRDHAIEPSEAVKNIVQALQMVVSTDQAFEHWHVFEKVCHAFNENQVHFGAMQPVEMDEAARAVKILQTIRPKAEFDSEVCTYIAACAKNSGIVYLPQDLFPGCSQDALDGMNNNIELKELVKKGRPIEGNEALTVQLQRLAAIKDYVEAT